jgi:4-aminobutyrate aminotransferase-like enzyme
MQAIELVEDDEARTPNAALAAATTAEALERGLVLLACGLYGNVVRVLAPLVIADEDLDRGLEILEESLVAAGARG